MRQLKALKVLLAADHLREHWGIELVDCGALERARRALERQPIADDEATVTEEMAGTLQKLDQQLVLLPGRRRKV